MMRCGLSAFMLCNLAVLISLLPLAAVDAKVCPSMVVQARPQSLEMLRNCTIIMGHLKVVLISTTRDASAFDKHVFPELVEVEDYVMFYGVKHLTSIGKIFPNLKVIRGNVLYLGSALVSWKMEGLEEIGLTNLQYIGRGTVATGSCPKLCYADTIDWKQIGASGYESQDNNTYTCAYKFCPSQCDGFCWNARHCQKRFDQISCHPQCIGCTKENSPKHCNTCRYYEDHGVCVETCPPSKYAIDKSMKCLTEEECHSILDGTWWVLQNTSCIQSCPLYHEQIDEPERDCREMKNYQRTCEGTEIDSVVKLEKMALCTHINGSLSLTLSKALFETEQSLEANLGRITSISGSLTIGPSSAVRSLKFLKSLKVIEGQDLDLGHSDFTLFVRQNPNLRKLWDFTDDFSLNVTNGIVVFFKNPKLCYSEIEKLFNLTHVSDKYQSELISEYWSTHEDSICSQEDS